MEYYCNVCRATITQEEFNYSSQFFKKPLCRGCQKISKSFATVISKKLCFALRKRGIPAKSELFDGNKHIDIAIPSLKINIEVDGGHHNSDYRQAFSDLKRTYHSLKKGYYTLRIPNSLLYSDYFDETLDYIVKILDEMRKLKGIKTSSA